MWCCLVMAGPGSQSSIVGASRGSTEWRKLCLDFSLFLAGSCSYRGCRGSFSSLSFSTWDETARLICGGAIPHNKYRSSTLVGLRHPEMALHAAFRTGSIFEACDDLLQTGDAYSAAEKHRARAVVRIVLASVPGGSRGPGGHVPP